ncbi:MAG: hypothetical protein PVG72_11790 [Gammaproteobacteria bacterium]
MNNPGCRLVAVLFAVAALPLSADDWMYRGQIIAEPATGRFSVCFDHSCRTIVTRAVSSQEWQLITAPLQTPASVAADERAAIAHAIALMEQTVGNKTGTSGDRGGNLAGFGTPGQMDCIDESNNTTTYLKLLQQAGLLKFHEVRERSTRFGLFAGMPHTTAVIRDIENRQDYVVDSWFFDNGERPVIMPLEEWKSGWSPDDDRHE